MSKYAKYSTNMGKLHEAVSVSYHEAGHTLISLLAFSKIDAVYLFENIEENQEDVLGYTKYELFKDFSESEDQQIINYLLNSYICINYAGMIAEKIHLKNTSGIDVFPKIFKNGCVTDIKEVSDTIKKYNLALPGRSRYLFKNKMMKKTAKLLKLYWDDVILIAHAVYKKRINHKDLKKILSKSKNKEFWKEHFKKIELLHSSSNDLDIKNILEI